MSEQKNDAEHIRQYIQKHERYFELLGFPAPGRAPALLRRAAARGVAPGTWPR